MVRKLKYHEKKLLKKVDFIDWKAGNNLKEVKILKKYHLQKREDYSKYHHLAQSVRSIAQKLKQLRNDDPFRKECTARLLQKLYMTGLVENMWDLLNCATVTAESFCARRLPVIMVKNKMVNSVKVATMLIEQGHVRIGPELVKDPAYLISRNLEDLINWVDTSKIKRQISAYNDMEDDFVS